MTNRERNSSTDSSDRVGRCAISTCFFLSGPTRYLTGPNVLSDGRKAGAPEPEGVGAPPGLLLGVVLDDELLLDGQVDLRPNRKLVHQDAHARRDRLEPRGNDALAVGLASHDERGHLERLLAHVDDVVGRHLVQRDVDLLAVHLEVTVHDELTRVAAGPGEAGAVHHVVETALEELQQVVTGLAGTTRCLDVVVVELALEDAVGEASLLLLLQLRAVLALLDAGAAVLAGGVRATLVSLVAANEVDAETTRLLGHGAGVTGHFYKSPVLGRAVRRGDAWAGGSRCAAWA